MTSGKRFLIAKGKGYLNAAGPQARFITFLLFILVAYTLLLRVFQKLAEIAQFPVFLPIALFTLLIFIGFVGTLYSHKFIGPVARIRKTIAQIAEGDFAVSLRLRESDDPMMKDMVEAITQLCERTRNAHLTIQNAAWELSEDIRALQEKIKQGAERSELLNHFERMSKKLETLQQAIKSFRKA